MLINLIGNGIKYTLNGSVAVAAKPDKAFVRVAIQDTGLGMAPDAQKHLFEKFYRIRTAETETIAGTRSWALRNKVDDREDGRHDLSRQLTRPGKRFLRYGSR